jgi:hypothetical protein
VASFAFAVGHFYLNYLAGFYSPWYVPTLTALAFIALAGLVSDLGGVRAAFPKSTRWPLMAATLLLPLGAGGLAICASYQLRLAQRICETGNRRILGEWLKAHAASPHDTVLLECLGYIGYFSNLKMYDYPGLSSPEVVAARRHLTFVGEYYKYFTPLISTLQPDWLVLRENEARSVEADDPLLLTRKYRLVRLFDVRDQVGTIRFLPGRGYLAIDSHFEVYHRCPPMTDRAPPPVARTPITVASLLSNQAWDRPAFESGGRILAHGPSRLTVRIMPGARVLTGKFGLLSGAYANPLAGTRGAQFTVNVLSREGKSTTLYLQALMPIQRPADRGNQDFSVAIPATATVAEFVVDPPTGGNNSFCWAYWSDLAFGVSRQ